MRASGILLHISSLPSDYGIGTVGKAAYEFIDFLKDSGQSYWQILPIGQTGYADSPYQSFSSFAANPYFIDLDMLSDWGFLDAEDYKNVYWGENSTQVDYGTLYKNRYKVLQLAVKRFLEKEDEKFEKFVEQNKFWLHSYSKFMTLKDLYGGISWLEWPQEYKTRDAEALKKLEKEYSAQIIFWQVVQYFFYKQWKLLKKYAKENGVKIIGDLPIYVSMDSADVWASPEQFYLNQKLEPVYIAGVPPDAFSEEGQLWGNPIFRWDKMKKDNYSWWISRLAHTKEIFDVIRIDHFRGFDSYYIVAADEKTAKNGKWKKGPGIEFFNAIQKSLGEISFIAEDLGFLTPSALKLVQDSGFPGMRILQFAFNAWEDNLYLPHNHIKNTVVYTGTHDNSTVLGWVENSDEETIEFAQKYLRLDKEEGYNWDMMKAALASVSRLCILQMQDLIGLDDSARMNTPSTVLGNWQWRAQPEDFTKELAEKLYDYTDIYRRLPKKIERNSTE